MKAVWKFPFTIEDDLHIKMPRFAKVLHVEVQAGAPCLWALVDPQEKQETRRFRIHGTGHENIMGDEMHVATFQQGPFVWHLFEVPIEAAEAGGQ